jgi:tRNA A37 N6-isopentenylltransferase MiaA
MHLHCSGADDSMFKRQAYLLAGPTASGKSSIAATLAREFNAPILSADSMLVYRGMDVGTAKPSLDERREFNMGGVDIVTPAEEFSSGAWLRAAALWAKNIPATAPIIIVGGTGLYFSALLRGLDRKWEKPPPAYPVIQIDRAILRERIRARLDDMFLSGLEEEKSRLHKLYPQWSRTASLAIGYREGDTKEKIFIRTCQLAKRQDTWFRHQATPLYVAPTVEAVRQCWLTHGPWDVQFEEPLNAETRENRSPDLRPLCDR